MRRASKMECEAEIRTITMVIPAAVLPSERRVVTLSSLDLVVRYASYMQRILFYSYNKSDETHIAHILKQSLSTVLSYYYPLAGRFVRDEDDRPFVECNNAGVEFVEAGLEHLSSTDLLTSPNNPRLLKNLVRMGRFSRSDLPSIPLLSVQLTWLRHGEFSLGLAYNHLFMDGHSFWYFLKAWSQYARHEQLHIFPCLKRNLLIDSASGNLSSLIDTNYKCLYSSADPNIYKIPPPLQQQVVCQTRVYKFSGHRIQKLKIRAAESYPERPPFSSFEVLCAYVWRSVILARALNDAEVTRFLFAVNCRRRLDPPLPESYFGNASCAACATITAGKLTKNSLFYAANLIHEAICGVTNTSIRALLSWCKQQQSTHFQMSRMRYDLFCGSSHRFPVYDIDFGWGSPVTVRTPTLPHEGVMLLFPCSDDARGIEVCLNLCIKTISRLEQILATDFEKHKLS